MGHKSGKCRGFAAVTQVSPFWGGPCILLKLCSGTRTRLSGGRRDVEGDARAPSPGRWARPFRYQRDRAQVILGAVGSAQRSLAAHTAPLGEARPRLYS